MQEPTSNPLSALSSLANIVNLFGGLKDLVKPLTQTTSSTSLPAFPIEGAECVWRSDNPDGASVVRANPPLPIYRIASNGSDAFVVEKATERAALGEPKWCTVDTGLPTEALSFLASKVKNDAEDKMREYVHTTSILLRSVLADDGTSLDLIRTTIRQAFERYDIPTHGQLLVGGKNGFEVKTTKAEEEVEPISMMGPDECESIASVQTSQEKPIVATERIRIEWTTPEGGYRKVVLDPHDKRLRFYNDASGPVAFSVLATSGTEQDVIDLVESFKRLGI